MTVTDVVLNGQRASISGGASTANASSIPSKGIIAWYGAVDNIPEGWALCDGTNGTPDLRDRFILGAGTNHAVGETGGEETHTLTVAEMPSHKHTGNGWSMAYGFTVASGSGARYTSGGSTNSDPGIGLTGGSQPHNNMPPYYALYYIMKL